MVRKMKIFFKYCIPILLFLILSFPVFAVFCSKCGYEAKNGGVYCSKCGEKLANLSVDNVDEFTEKDAIAFLEKKFLPVTKFETFISNSNYRTCIEKYPEFKLEYDKNFKVISARSPEFSKRAKKIMWLYVKKWAILKSLYQAWGMDVNNSSVVHQAYMIKYFYSLNQIDQIISYLKNNDSLAEAEKLLTTLAEREKIYKVTTKYLKVGSHCIPKGQPIWLEKIEKSRVKVLHIGSELLDKLALKRNPVIFSRLSKPVRGWVSKQEILKRTTWGN